VIRMSKHANEQCESRGFDPNEVSAVVNGKGERIQKSKSWEVRVIVKVFRAILHLPDGSNGDCVVACVDPESRTVKTVMLQRRTQVEHKKHYREADYLD
jgi:hypothetical protein